MEAIATQRQHHFSAAERGEWISLYRSSQLPASQFAPQHGLNLGTLYRWLRQERQHSSADTEASGFQEVHLSSFLPTRAWVAEITLPDGVVVRLSAAATPAWIKLLLQMLRPTC
jgi:transposase-like protein